MTISLEELIATAQPRTMEVRVCARGDLVDRHAELVAELDAAAESGSIGGNPEVRRIAQAITEVEAEQEAHTITFRMRPVSRRVWADLIAAHPPRDIDRENGLDHNPITFPIAAVAACCAAPEVSLDDAERLAEVLPTGEWAKLWLAVVALNKLETPHPKLPAALSIARESGDS